MAVEQYTRCIEPSEFASRARIITIQTLLAGVPAALIAVAANRPDCLWIAAEIAAMAAVVAYCRNWLYHRLLCLGGDRDLLGAIVSISPPSSDLIFSSSEGDFWDLDWDTDYSINLLLENTAFGVCQAAPVCEFPAEQSSPSGDLIAPQPGVTAIGRGTPGHTALDEATQTTSAVLHAEFEGGGNYDLLLGAEAGLGLSIAALIACLLPFFGLPVVLILGLLALLALIVAGLLGNSDFGSPSDVGAGELHPNADANGGLGAGADVVYVQGTWVYDSLHDGWNEIHPIKVCTKMGCWNGDWTNIACKDGDESAPPPDIILRVREGFRVAQAEETLANQARAEHRWRLHPDLDGCARGAIL